MKKNKDIGIPVGNCAFPRNADGKETVERNLLL